MIDIGDRTRRWHCLQVLVVEAAIHDGPFQLKPVFLRRNMDSGVVEKCYYLLGRGSSLSSLPSQDQFGPVAFIE